MQTMRDNLETQALATVSSEHYHDLTAVIGELEDKDLRLIIACDGDYEAEMNLYP